MSAIRAVSDAIAFGGECHYGRVWSHAVTNNVTDERTNTYYVVD